MHSLKKEFYLLVLKKVKILILILFLFGFVYNAKADDPPPPPPPIGLDSVPIDDSLLLAIVIAVSFGIYIICKNKLKQKTPI